jgi:hypothetical protein
MFKAKCNNNKHLAQVEEKLKTLMIILERTHNCNNFGSASLESAKFDIDNFSTKVDDTPPSSLMDLIASPKVKKTEGEGVGSLARITSGVEGRAGAPRWD